MRRRTRTPDTSADSKKCKIKQRQSTKIMTEKDEKVLLDFLVVEKIASLTKQKFVQHISQEHVSRSFSIALHSLNSSEKLTLSISTCVVLDIALLSVSGSSRRWNEEIKIDKDCLNHVVQQIFARFPQINLKLRCEEIEHLTSIVLDVLNINHGVMIESLEIKSGDFTRCHELIKKLSSNLKVLKLKFDDRAEEYDSSISEKLWQAVSSCAELVKLGTIFETELSLTDEHPFCIQLLECLQLLKVKQYRTNLLIARGSNVMKYLPRAFEQNENLRQLVLTCDTEYCYFDGFDGCEEFLPIFSRLDSLKIRTAYEDEYDDRWEVTVGKILPILRDRGLLTISVVIQSETGEEHSLDMLEIYLKLSHQWAKPMKLRLLIDRFWDDSPPPLRTAADMFNGALNRLSSMDEFHGLKTISSGKWTRILFSHANLMVKARLNS